MVLLLFTSPDFVHFHFIAMILILYAILTTLQVVTLFIAIECELYR